MSGGTIDEGALDDVVTIMDRLEEWEEKWCLLLGQFQDFYHAGDCFIDYEDNPFVAEMLLN